MITPLQKQLYGGELPSVCRIEGELTKRFEPNQKLFIKRCGFGSLERPVIRSITGLLGKRGSLDSGRRTGGIAIVPATF
jgi:hypothetical protein